MKAIWKRVLAVARLGAIIAGKAQIKGVPVEVIAETAEREGKHIADAVTEMKKDAKPKD